MTDMRGMEMKLHKQADKISQIEAKVDKLLEMIEDLNQKLNTPVETTPVDRNYKGFETPTILSGGL
jgi:hypothetical protein